MSQEQDPQLHGSANSNIEDAVDSTEALYGVPRPYTDWNAPSEEVQGMTKPQVDMAHEVADQGDPEGPKTKLDDALAPWTNRGFDTPESDEPNVTPGENKE